MNKKKTYEWVVIGAGPAGIATVGKLIDHNILKESIAWIDPSFTVGDLGSKWFNVPSNTKVSLFLKFLMGSNAFNFKNCTKSFTLNELSPHDHCLLKEIADPLQWVTHHLASLVSTIKEEAISLNFSSGYWNIETKSSSIQAKNVVLATGSEPKQLSLGHSSIIPIEVALNPNLLAEEVERNDVIGVFGSSHSAILVLANLLELHPKMVINFYRSPHLYAIELEDWIVFDNIGLKGKAAKWAKKNLEDSLPKNLLRIHSNDIEFEEKLSLCNKLVYAVGFEPRKLPVIEQYPKAHYQETTGIIAPHLFGIGIAYPQAQIDPFGNKEYRVGLWKFMDYLNFCLPLWLKYSSEN